LLFEQPWRRAKKGDPVVVEGDFCVTLGHVLKTATSDENSSKPVIRKATQEDFEAFEKNLSLEKEAWDFCLERIRERQLPMKLLVVEAALDRKRIIFILHQRAELISESLLKTLLPDLKQE